MLVLSRAVGQGVVLPDCGARLSILKVRGKKVCVGVDAPAEIAVHRDETWAKIQSREDEVNSGRAVSRRPLDVLWLDLTSRSRDTRLDSLPAVAVQIKVVRSPEECFQLLAASVPDVLAVSLGAPSAEIDFLSQLRRQGNWGALPIVFVQPGRAAAVGADGVKASLRIRRSSSSPERLACVVAGALSAQELPLNGREA